MSNDLENLARVVAAQVIESPMKELRLEVREGFAALDRRFDERDKRLLDEFMNRIKPVVGEFKDQAVEESRQHSNDIFKRIFNISPDNNQEVKELQGVMRFAELMLRSSRFILVIIFLCLALAFSVASGKGMNFLNNFGAFFLGR